jgi:nucleoside 2-deoxyribosyltransferase
VRIYVASSWRNEKQPSVVEALRAAGHDVYDFRHPQPGNEGFHWSEIDPAWRQWTPERFRNALADPIADRGFGFDVQALAGCDACVLVLPSGRSAHLELGYAAGAGKPTFVLMLGPDEPELMYKLCDRVCLSIDEVVASLAAVEVGALL